jgi:hypothetical protein
VLWLGTLIPPAPGGNKLALDGMKNERRFPRQVSARMCGYENLQLKPMENAPARYGFSEAGVLCDARLRSAEGALATGK